MQLLLVKTALLLFGALALGSCADNDFFQKDAQVAPPPHDPVSAEGADSVWVAVGRHYERSGIHNFFWGSHNRFLWATPVKVEVFRMDKTLGGLRLLKRGGGFQTVSFQLRDGNGRTYALRSLDKDPVEVLPPFWKKTFVANIVRDQTAAANPFGALVVAALAEAAGVLHTSPGLVYIRHDDLTFGEYAHFVQGRVFLLENKYKSDADLTDSFGNATDLLDSETMLNYRFSDNRYQVNQRAFAKARLLDVLIGDWDRHKDQWNWAVVQNGPEVTFEPVPKDRDQAFLNMNNGLVPSIATSKLFVRKFNSFSKEIEDVAALMINSAYIDERFLNELTREDWTGVAQALQASLTDEAIDGAVQKFPPPVFKSIGRAIGASLKSRRDQLPQVAEKMYLLLAEKPAVAGTDGREQFKVMRLNDQETAVTVERISKNAPPQVLYNRIFKHSETKEITLHGLAGNDEFLVEGAVGKSIRINIYGGLGEDKITDRSSVRGWRSYTYIYDTARGNKIDFGTEAKDKTTSDVRVHAYDREGHK